MSQSSDPSEALIQVLLNVTRELWVMKDRQLVLEQVLEEAGIRVAEAVETYQPDADFAARLERERKRLLDQCLAPATKGN